MAFAVVLRGANAYDRGSGCPPKGIYMRERSRPVRSLARKQNEGGGGGKNETCSRGVTQCVAQRGRIEEAKMTLARNAVSPGFFSDWGHFLENGTFFQVF